MLPAAEHLVDHLPGEVDGGVPRHPDVAAGQGAADQVLAQHGGGVPDGVTFGHLSAAAFRVACGRIRRPTSALSGPAARPRGARRAGTPSTRSTRIDATRREATRSASAVAAARWAAGSSVKVSSDRPPRSRNQASSPSTSTTSAPALRPGRCALAARGRPGQRRAVRVGRVRGGQHDRPVLRPFGIDPVAEVAQPVDGRRDGELRAAQRLDEVAALASAGVLEGAQHLVQGGEPAGDALGGHRAPGQHAVPAQQQLRLVVGAQRGIRLGGGQDRPSAGHGRVGGPGLRVRDAVAAQPRRAMRPVRRGARACGSRRRRAVARTGANVSPVIQPAQISSHSAALRSRRRESRSGRADGRSRRRRRPACPGWRGGRR